MCIFSSCSVSNLSDSEAANSITDFSCTNQKVKRMNTLILLLLLFLFPVFFSDCNTVPGLFFEHSSISFHHSAWGPLAPRLSAAPWLRVNCACNVMFCSCLGSFPLDMDSAGCSQCSLTHQRERERKKTITRFLRSPPFDNPCSLYLPFFSLLHVLFLAFCFHFAPMSPPPTTTSLYIFALSDSLPSALIFPLEHVFGGL